MCQWLTSIVSKQRGTSQVSKDCQQPQLAPKICWTNDGRSIFGRGQKNVGGIFVDGESTELTQATSRQQMKGRLAAAEKTPDPASFASCCEHQDYQNGPGFDSASSYSSVAAGSSKTCACLSQPQNSSIETIFTFNTRRWSMPTYVHHTRSTRSKCFVNSMDWWR